MNFLDDSTYHWLARGLNRKEWIMNLGQMQIQQVGTRLHFTALRTTEPVSRVVVTVEGVHRFEFLKAIWDAASNFCAES